MMTTSKSASRVGTQLIRQAQDQNLEVVRLSTARFATNCNNDTIKKQIDKGIPVPVGILHHGPAGAPSGGGHWLTVVGYNGNGFICNDPWGEINHANGTYTKTNGKQVLYSYKLFDSRWTVAGSSDGWAILVD
jgi:hypothetical protein